MRRAVVSLAAISFLGEILIAEGWLRLARGRSVLDLLDPGANPMTSLVAGVIAGVAVAAATRVFFSTIAWRITREQFLPLFQKASSGEIALLSLLPGFGEEILFRGTIQPEIGLAATSLVFGLMHSGFSRYLLPYGLWSAAVGAILGGLYLWTGTLWASIVAHALINASGALWARSLRESQPPPSEE